MNKRKNLFIIIFTLSQALMLFAQSPKDFVCRVVPSENDNTYKMLQSAQSRFEEYNYKYEADKIKRFLTDTGNTGVIIRDDAGKKYVLTSGEESLSDFTTFDIQFAPDHNPEPVVLRGLKISALDTEYNFLLIELPDNYSGKALRVTNASPVQGQNVIVPDFSTSHWEEHYVTVSDTYADRNYFILTYKDAPVGSPVLLHDNNTDSAYTLLGINHKDKNGIAQAEKTPAISSFLNNWSNMKSDDPELPLNLFISMINKKVSNSNRKSIGSTESSVSLEEIGDTFISTELLRKFGADLYISNSGNSKYGNKYSNDPYKGILFVTAEIIKNLFNNNSSLSVDSVVINKDYAKVVFEKDSEPIQTEWIKENGSWKLSSVEGLEQKIKLKKYKDNGWIDDPYYGDPFILNIRASLLVPTEYSRADNKGFDITALGTFQHIGAGLFFQQEKLVMDYSGGTGEHRASSFGGLIRFQIPINAWRFMLVPFIEGRLGFTNVSEIFDDKSARLFFGSDFGVDLCFVINEYVAPYVTFSGNNVSYSNTEHTSSFEFSAGIRLLGILDYDNFW
ncbi:MAG: hypothetical protein J5857_04030 [Treponema sp.]|nr:hypothetical protein [Treponema sp.]